jgi:hypothetical protein
VARWTPPHPASWMITRNTCAVGQRYRTLELLNAHAVPVQLVTLAGKLVRVTCIQCDGYHLVNDEDLKRHRRVLTVVSAEAPEEK